MNVVDCSVGTIVWVRRRNGSWWPGKILSSDELSATHLMSPRSGTPVKLLGREDASVDWYNLEKSKRVKPFRCGEFSECIERAEASMGIPPKKREKYARREDAILHALELEKQLLEAKGGKLDCSSNGKVIDSSDGVGEDSELALQRLVYRNGRNANSRLRKFPMEMDISLEEKNKVPLPQQPRVKAEKELSEHGENSKVHPRMRGLQDLGLRSAPSKCKLSSSAALNGSYELLPDDGVIAPVNVGLTIENAIHISRQFILSKRKRLQEGLAEESVSKKRDKCRPLVEVIESSALLPVLPSQQLPSDDGVVSPPLLEDDQTVILGHETSAKCMNMQGKPNDSLESSDIPQVGTPCFQFEKSDHHFQVDVRAKIASGSSEDTKPDSSASASLESAKDDSLTAHSDDAAPVEPRPKSPEKSETQGHQQSMSSEELDGLAFSDETLPSYSNEPFSATVPVSKWQMKGKRNNRSCTKRYLSVTDSKISNVSTVRGHGSNNYNYTNSEAHLDRSGELCSKLLDRDHSSGGRVKTLLVDVELKVQSTNQRERVPMISLMSKFNGKAIVGHPIPVEVMDENSSETLLFVEDFQTDPLDSDTSLQKPAWRTARRTTSTRVPRPHRHSSSLPYGEQNRLFGRSNAKGSSRKLSCKQSKKVSLYSSQKIRTLSSLSTQLKQNNTDLDLQNGYEGDSGLIKPEHLPTAVACIPVKLVFSRLHEQLFARHQ